MRVRIPVLSTTAPGFRRAFDRLRRRSDEGAARAEERARAIVEDVRRRGDRALFAWTARLDGVDLRQCGLRVSEEEMEAAERSLPRPLRSALRLAARRIRVFHQRQRERSWRFRDPVGLVLGQRIQPLERVGVYVPGGHGAYPSSVLMNVIPARVAGVDEVIMASPAGREGHAPAVLAAARIAGVTSVYRIGGAQAVAALAFGTASVPRVDKIVGPGNAYVQAAKRLVYGQVDIDTVAGPSEVLVIADDSAPPAWVAADLLAQAEHGSGDESAILLSPSREVVEAVRGELLRRLPRLPRRDQIAAVLERGSALIEVRDLEEAIALAEEIAPEHLEIMTRDPSAVAARLRRAGAIFLGPWSPAPLGDYLAGPNHVLPTGGTARFSSPLGVYDFVKRTSIVAATARGIATLAEAVETLAAAEGYEAHAEAVRLRRSARRRLTRRGRARSNGRRE